MRLLQYCCATTVAWLTLLHAEHSLNRLSVQGVVVNVRHVEDVPEVRIPGEQDLVHPQSDGQAMFSQD